MGIDIMDYENKVMKSTCQSIKQVNRSKLNNDLIYGHHYVSHYRQNTVVLSRENPDFYLHGFNKKQLSIRKESSFTNSLACTLPQGINQST